MTFVMASTLSPSPLSHSSIKTTTTTTTTPSRRIYYTLQPQQSGGVSSTNLCSSGIPLPLPHKRTTGTLRTGTCSTQNSGATTKTVTQKILNNATTIASATGTNGTHRYTYYHDPRNSTGSTQQTVRPSTAPTTGNSTRGIAAIVRLRPCATDADAVAQTTHTTIMIQSGKRVNKYTVDTVLPTNATQKDVFESVQPMLLPDNYSVQPPNVTIFTYGATGHGKTWTMSGSGTGESKGLIARVLEHVFSVPHDNVRISYLEIYSEQITDLMPGSVAEKLSLRGSGTALSPFYVEHLRILPVSNVQSAIELFQAGTARRSICSTRANEISSRSHTVFTVYIESSGSTRKINLLDLAGSEDQRSTDTSGKALKEAAAINTSLSELKNVIRAMKRSAKHVSFRNSVLTQLLADSLVGRGRACLIACIALSKSGLSDAESTLKFAADIKDIKVTSSASSRIEDSITDLPTAIRKIKELAQLLHRNERNTLSGTILNEDTSSKLTDGLLDLSYSYDLNSDSPLPSSKLQSLSNEILLPQLLNQSTSDNEAVFLLDSDDEYSPQVSIHEKIQMLQKTNRLMKGKLVSAVQQQHDYDKRFQSMEDHLSAFAAEVEALKTAKSELLKNFEKSQASLNDLASRHSVLRMRYANLQNENHRKHQLLHSLLKQRNAYTSAVGDRISTSNDAHSLATHSLIKAQLPLVNHEESQTNMLHEKAFADENMSAEIIVDSPTLHGTHSSAEVPMISKPSKEYRCLGLENSPNLSPNLSLKVKPLHVRSSSANNTMIR